MTKINLKSKTRSLPGKKAGKLRKEGKIPAVLYGNKVSSQSLWVDYLDFQKTFHEAGESTIFELEIDGKRKANVLIYDVQKDPISGKYSHIDFFQVRMDQKIETDVPLEFVGESDAVKTLGGVLVKSIDTVPVICLPADLPPKIEIDISALKTFNDAIKISDLKVSDKVSIQVDPETVITNVAPPRSEEEIAGLSEKVEEDVTKVEGVVKEAPEEEKSAEEEPEKKSK
jgi:large subunit ribosomal protein L25